MKYTAYCTIVILSIFFSLSAEIIYKNDFEGSNELSFVALVAPQWIGSLKRAQQEGFLTLHYSGLSEFNERNHDGVYSYLIDMTLHKGEQQHGASCIFGDGKLNYPLDKPVWLTGYIYPELLPPDINLNLGFTFTFQKDGKRVHGSLVLPLAGRDSGGWMVFSADLSELAKKFDQPVLTGWIVRTRGNKKFHGQRVKFYVDNISITSKQPEIHIASTSAPRGNDVDSNDPYVVNYRSLYREFPKEAKNLAFNSSFELGMRDWYPRVQRSEVNNTSLPDPWKIFKVVEQKDAPHGRRVFKIERNGESSNITLGTRPYRIEDGKDYVLSWYAKASKPTRVKVCHHDIELSTEWRRYTIKFPKIKCFETWQKKQFPGRFAVILQNNSNVDIWLDAFQFEKNDITPYTGREILEFSARPEKQFGLYSKEETPNFKVEFFNDALQENRGVFQWLLKDYRHQLIAEGKETVIVGAGAFAKRTITAKAGKNFYKLFCTLTVSGQPEQTFVTSAAVIPDLTGIKENEFFGSCTIEGANPPNLKTTLEINRMLGMSFNMLYHLNHTRAPENWREKNPLWAQLDTIIAINRQYGFDVIWANYHPFPPGTQTDSSGVHIITPEVEKDITDYATEMARRYQGKILMYNYCGEYLKSPLEKRCDTIAKVIQAAHQGLKAGDPNALIAGVAQNHMDNILTTYSELAKRGTFALLDRVSIHPYGFGRNLEMHETMLKLKAQLDKDVPGKTNLMLGTEGGTGSTDILYYDDIAGESLHYPFYRSELSQAEYDIRMNLMMLGSGIFSRNAAFYPYEGNVHGRKFFHFVNPDNGIAPRPVFPAYAYMVERLAGAKTVGEFEQRKSTGLQGYFFRKNEKISAVAWLYTADFARHRGIIPLPANKIRAFNLMGEELELKGNDYTELMLGGDAVWLEPVDCSETEFIDAMRNLQVIQPIVALRYLPKRKIFEVTVDNQSSEPIEGKIYLCPQNIVKDIILPAKQNRLLEFPSNMSPEVIAWSAELQSHAGKFVSPELRPLPVARTSTPPEFNASLSVFKKWHSLGGSHLHSAAGFPLRGKDDLSARVALLYDDQNLYLGVEVTDDRHHTPHTEEHLLWANDALQLLFVMSGNLRDRSLSNLHELAISDTPNGPRVGSTLIGGKPFDSSLIRCAIKREGDKTRYEVGIPWKTLHPDFQPDNSVIPGFNIAISDNDGGKGWMPMLKGYEKSLQMSKGLVDEKNPATALSLFFE